tara:strand:+ start:13507 stop:14241 length:735 start_codon:yes stop_codon:yes gene_type:complete
MSNQMMVRNDSKLQIEFTTTALERREELIAEVSLFNKVDSAIENEIAVQHMQALKVLGDECEKERKIVKDPITKYGKAIDAKSNWYKEEPREQYRRLGKLCADFQALEAAKVKAAEAARRVELEAEERARQEALAKVESIDEQNEVNEQYNEAQRERSQAALASNETPIAPSRAKGQVVKVDWRIEVTNADQLARAHPNCVKITPILPEIKMLLNEGFSIMGIRAEKVTTVGVRAQRQSKAIEA